MEQMILISRQDFQNDLRDLVTAVIKDALHQDPLQVKQQEQYLTFSETCEAFDCSSVTLHKWKREGKIKFYRMGGKIYFKRSEVYGLQAAKIAK